jgi:hypothetical protein
MELIRKKFRTHFLLNYYFPSPININSSELICHCGIEPYIGYQKSCPSRLEFGRIQRYLPVKEVSMGTAGLKTKSPGPKSNSFESGHPFEVKDCTLITRMAGIETAINLRELRERLRSCPLECLFHHFCETAVRPGFDDPEFRNDFAVWAARQLRDRILAEKLGIINPYLFKDLEDVRQTTIDIIDEHSAELPNIPWVRKGNDFRFMRAVTVVFDTDLVLEEPARLKQAIREMNLSSLYYHYVDARRRNNLHLDDFTVWLNSFGGKYEHIKAALAGVDFYFLNLYELKTHLLKVLEKVEMVTQ